MNWAAVPQFFLDLIGRVMPGAAVLPMASAVAFGPTQAVMLALEPNVAKYLFGVGPFVVLALVSYVIGLSAHELWRQTIGRLKADADARTVSSAARDRLSEHNAIQKAMGLPAVQLTEDKLPRLFVMHDQLRFAANGEALRLLKLRAEQRLCRVVVLGAATCGTWNAWLLIRSPSMERAIVEAGLLLVAIGCWSKDVQHEKLFANGTHVAWLNYASAGLLLTQRERFQPGSPAGAGADAGVSLDKVDTSA